MSVERSNSTCLDKLSATRMSAWLAATAPKRRLAPYARVKQYLKEGTGRGALDARRADAFARPSWWPQFGVSRMTVNRALRELQAEGLVDRVAGRRHLRRAAAPRLVHADDPRPARGDRGARPSPPRARCTWQREERAPRRAGRAARPGDRRAGVPHADRPPRERRAAAVRRPLRQPGLRARLPRASTSPATTPTHYLLRSRRSGRRSTRSRRARRRRRRRGCSASSAASPAWSWCGAR